MNGKKREGPAPGWLRTLFWLLAVVPLGWVVANRSGEILQRLQMVTWGQFSLPLGLAVLIMPLMALNSWASLRYLGGRFNCLEAAGFYFSSQAPKYLPGGFWAMPSRMVFYRSRGMPAADSVLSVLREVAALFLGGAAVGVLGLFNQAAAPEVRWAVGLGAGFSFVLILLTSTAVFWRLISSLPIGIQLPFAELMNNAGKRSLRWLPLTLGLSMVFWLMLGAAFRSLILAFEPGVVITWIEAASVFALAWCGGFVVVFIPAGLGVRETLLTVLLTRWMPEGSALTIALAARAWWMLAEAVYIVISMFWLIRTTELGPVLRRLRGRRNEGLEEGSEHEEYG